MLEEEKQNLFVTMECVIKDAIKEKMQIPSWKKKIEAASVAVNLGLEITKTDYFFIGFSIQPGKDVEMKIGKYDPYDLELLAVPDDLIYFCNGTFSTIHMVTKKNEFGETKLRVKKGFRNVGKLLFVQGLLNVQIKK